MKLLFSLIVIFIMSQKNDDMYSETNLQENLKSKAFQVLRHKCNTCHATKKKLAVFTLDNMSTLAPDIYTQVFVKKKMPKGKKVQLSVAESNALKLWLNKTLATRQ